MSTDDPTPGTPQWLSGIARVDASTTLPTRACASGSALRAVDVDDSAEIIDMIPRGRAGLRLIFNDDHGLTPSVTIVNHTAATLVLRAVRPALLATDHGTYDLDAVLGGSPRTIEPGRPLVIRITDIGRNAGEPLRLGAASPATPRRAQARRASRVRPTTDR